MAHPALVWVGSFLLGSAGGAAGAAVVNKVEANKKGAAALPASQTKTNGVDDFGADMTSIDGTTGSWIPATNADVQRDKVTHLYNGLLKKDVGKERLAKVGDRIWKLKVVSKVTDPDFTTHEKDVRGWVWNCESTAKDEDDEDITSGAEDLGAVYKIPLTKKELVLEVRKRDEAALPAAPDAPSSPVVSASLVATPPPKLAVTASLAAPPPPSKGKVSGADDLGDVDVFSGDITLDSTGGFEGLDEAIFSGDITLDSTGGFEGLGDQLFAVGSKAGGAALNLFVPGAGVLADQLGTKVKAQVDKSTGHDPNAGKMPVSALPGFIADGSGTATSKPNGKVVIKAQIDNQGLQGEKQMTDTNDRLGHGEIPTSVSGPGELPGKPSPFWYGAVRNGNGYWWPAPDRMQTILVKGKRQPRALMMIQYKKALDSWTARNRIYQRLQSNQPAAGRQRLMVGIPLQRQVAALSEQIAILQQGGDIDQDPDASLFDDGGYYSQLDDGFADPSDQGQYGQQQYVQTNGLYGTESVDGGESVDGELDEMGAIMPRGNPGQRHAARRPPAQHRQPFHGPTPTEVALMKQLQSGKLDIAALEHALQQAGHILNHATRRAETEIQMHRGASGFAGTDGVRPPPAPANMGNADEGTSGGFEGDGGFDGEEHERTSGESDLGGVPRLPPPPPDPDAMAGVDCGCPNMN